MYNGARCREEIAKLTAMSKSQNMAKTVQKVQTRLREQELVSDVLKSMLQSAGSMSRDEVRGSRSGRAVR